MKSTDVTESRQRLVGLVGLLVLHAAICLRLVFLSVGGCGRWTPISLYLFTETPLFSLMSPEEFSFGESNRVRSKYAQTRKVSMQVIMYDVRSREVDVETGEGGNGNRKKIVTYTTLVFKPEPPPLITTIMSAETPLKDLPKVDPTLKGQLEGFSAVNLKKIETEEKIHLPNKEDIETERTHQSLFQGVTGFDKTSMRHAETQEKVTLPAKEDIETEKTHQSIFQGVTGFDKSQMRHAETEEKVSLPAKEDIEQEKTHQNIFQGVATFDKSTMRQTSTTERVSLPSPEDIKLERTHQGIFQRLVSFDKSEMKPTETIERNILPSQTDIENEKGQQALRQGIEGFDHTALKKAQTAEKNTLPTKEMIEEEKKA
ncbi:uncharacterized protein LOC122248830 isoform X13 [Penaeus japonicus]|uniref:uncharacterized protein LOC122248830 isoform X13 n=1 Tax=Penaeus japonicus TaxID=27405 RepID=UPI001C70CCE9|nr:uncharacterized protein LOC122248830 isoform X13 [Penaeus japonicus]